MKRSHDLAVATVLASAFLTGPAFAYLDAASVSMALQVVVGGIAGILLLGKVYLGRITSLFRGSAPSPSSPAAAPVAQGESERA